MSPTPVLSVEGVEVARGRLAVVRGVSLEVGAGEVLALLGPNGAGKTTLVEAIAGLLPLRSGALRVDGVAVGHPTPPRMLAHGVALVPQGRMLFPGMSVRDNLVMGAHLSRRDRPVVRRRYGDVLEMFPRLRTRERIPVRSLSGGEQQMVAVGRALMSGPRLLVLDEPTHGLSPIATIELVERLRALVAEGGRAVLIVEQNLEAIRSLPDRFGFMAAGEITRLTAGADIDAQSASDAYFGAVEGDTS